MRYFSVPADFKFETIDGYYQLNKEYAISNIFETYGQITVGNLFESGRSIDLLPKIDICNLKKYIEYSKEKGIGFNYTINASHIRNREFTESGISELKYFLNQLYEAGVRSLTVALPSIIEIVKSTKLGFEIKVSTISQITNANKAISFKKLGIDRIVVDESINRNFRELKSIRKVFGSRVELIINPICYKDCINRIFHYNQMADDSVKLSSKASASYYNHRCLMRRFENVGNFMKISWIRPEDIKYYTDIGIEYFKLQGRHNVLKGDPIRTVEAYFKERFDGNLMDILDMFSNHNPFSMFVDNNKLEGFLEPFYEREYFCKNDCSECSYCQLYAEKAINSKKLEYTRELYNEFINGFDEFAYMLNNIESSNVKDITEEELNVIFNFDEVINQGGAEFE